MAEGGKVDDPADITADETLVAYGDACATLTPLIKETLRHVVSGGVVEVRTDDRSAREVLPAWARLTGNSLINTVEDDDEHTRFFIRKK
jgi:TusA-related sulfurtransferase